MVTEAEQQSVILGKVRPDSNRIQPAERFTYSLQWVMAQVHSCLSSRPDGVKGRNTYAVYVLRKERGRQNAEPGKHKEKQINIFLL